MSKNCILCKKQLRNKVYSLSNMPKLVQNLPTDENVDEDCGMDLNLYICDGCGLVQFDCEPVFYYKDVIRAVGLSSTIKELRLNQYTKLFKDYDLKGKKVLELGCGGGEFLELWKEYDVESYGIEHSSSLVETARGKELKVIEGYMDSTTELKEGPFDLVVSFNYLEHQPNPSDMVAGIYNNLNKDGICLLTVPSFEYFMEKASYYEFMRDHIAYYTECSLRNLFELNGFDIVDICRFNGDTTQVVAKKRSQLILPDFDAQRHFFEDYLNSYVKAQNIKNIAVWGASHQSLTMLATLNLDFDIECIIDSSPIKDGFYSPVTHYEIKMPKRVEFDQLDLIIIIAPAFYKEITTQINSINNNIRILAVFNDDVIEVQ